MKYVETVKPDKYECYSAPSNGNAIAKCVVTGAFVLSFTMTTPKIYAVPINNNPIEWVTGYKTCDKSQLELIDNKPFIDVSKLSLFSRIESIEELQNNWNGCGAVKPNTDAICNTKHLLEVLDSQVLKNLKSDDIYSSDYGSIILDFYTPKGLVSVEVGDTTMGFYTDFIDGNNYAAEGISTDFVSVPKTLELYLS